MEDKVNWKTVEVASDAESEAKGEPEGEVEELEQREIKQILYFKCNKYNWG
jgi:hypothetical protein